MYDTPSGNAIYKENKMGESINDGVNICSLSKKKIGERINTFCKYLGNNEHVSEKANSRKYKVSEKRDGGERINDGVNI